LCARFLCYLAQEDKEIKKRVKQVGNEYSTVHQAGRAVLQSRRADCRVGCPVQAAQLYRFLGRSYACRVVLHRLKTDTEIEVVEKG